MMKFLRFIYVFKDDNDCLNGQAPYALSFVSKTANNKVEKIEHKLIYWDEATGFHFSDTDERFFNQLGLVIFIGFADKTARIGNCILINLTFY